MPHLVRDAAVNSDSHFFGCDCGDSGEASETGRFYGFSKLGRRIDI